MNSGLCKEMWPGIVEQLIPDHIFNEIERLEQENLADVESIESLFANAPKIDDAVLDSLMAEITDDIFKYSEDELAAVLSEVEANLFDISDPGIEELDRNLNESAAESCFQQSETTKNIQQTLTGQVKQQQGNSQLQEDINQFEEIQRNFLNEMEQLKQLHELSTHKGMKLDREKNSVPLSPSGLSNREERVENQVLLNVRIHQEPETNSQLQERMKRVKAISIYNPQLSDIGQEEDRKYLQVEKASTINEEILMDNQYHSRHPTTNIVMVNNSEPFRDYDVTDRGELTQNKRLLNESNQQEEDLNDQRSSQSKRVCMISPAAQGQSQVVSTTNSRPPSPCLGNMSPQSIEESQVLLNPENKNANIDECHAEEYNDTNADEGEKIDDDGSCNNPEPLHISSSTEGSVKQHIELHDLENRNSASKSNVPLARRKRMRKGEKLYRCNVCNRSFTQKSNLTTHLRIHTGEKPYRCNVCNRSFTQKIHLTIHLRIHTGEKPYSCNVCNRSFTQQSYLTTHLRIHTGEKPYRCNVCNRSFTQKIHLTIHLRIHTGEKPYSCNVCNRSFTQKIHLTIHLRIHTGEKPYRCHVCNKSFTRKGDLTKHLRIHTEKKSNMSKLRQKSLRVKENLSAHLKSPAGENEI